MPSGESFDATELRHIAAGVIADYFYRGEYSRAAVEQLARLILGSDARAIEASRVLFSALVEPLADSFEPSGVSLYNRVFAQIVQFCRTTEREIDAELSRFGLKSETDLLTRVESLRPRPAGRLSTSAPGISTHLDGGSSRSPVQLAIVLSRVTLGADVAITGVLIERLKQTFPSAQIVLAGGSKMRELFGGDHRLSFQVVDYGRTASLSDRMSVWLQLAALVRSLTHGLSTDKYVIVDPDSRLTQLGVLPVCPDESYLFFPSREYLFESDESLGMLASSWSAKVLGGPALTPAVSLAAADIEVGRKIGMILGAGRSRKIVTLNFGVGGNESKRVGMEFERSLVEHLVGSRGSGSQDARPAIILDRGAGVGEDALVDSLIVRAAGNTADFVNLNIVEACEKSLPDVLSAHNHSPDILVWRGRIGLLAAMIKASDLYIGYDSMGQHIAAAVGVPCIDVAAGAVSQRFLDRWRPTGLARTTVIDAGGHSDWRRMLDEVEQSAGLILDAH